MLRNYIVVAWRNLRRNGLYAAVNTTALGVAIACGLLVLAYVRHELTYDAFHEKAERLYRVCEYRPSMTDPHLAFGGQAELDVGPDLAQWHSGIARAVRMRKETNLRLGRDPDAIEAKALFADPEVLESFSFRFASGDRNQALATPTEVLLTAAAARRLFGELDPMGREIWLNRDDWGHNADGFGGFTYTPYPFTVTGVLDDIPMNSSLAFEVLAHYDAAAALGIYGIRSLFVELSEGVAAEQVQTDLQDFVSTHMGEAPDRLQLHLQPLLSIHFDERTAHDRLGGEPGRLSQVYVLTGIALLIVAAASMNYANLGLAQALSRRREAGVRKTAGARRKQLMVQFWSESVLVSLLALALGAALAEAVSGPFGEMTGRALDPLEVSGATIWQALSLAAAIGLAAGFYPAVVLSGAPPAAVVRGVGRLGGGTTPERILTGAQLGLSVFLLTCVAVMTSQLDYMREKDLGFDADQVVSVSLRNDRPDMVQIFRHELASSEAIAAVSGSDPGAGMGYRRSTWQHEEDEIQINGFRVDEEFLATMGVRLTAGRWFEGREGEWREQVVINQALARRVGWDDPVGRQLSGFEGLKLEDPQVIGVVEDFHFFPVQHAIEPLILRLQSPYEGFGYLQVRLRRGRIAEGMAEIRRTWKQVAGETPFWYYPMDEHFDARLAESERWGRIVRWSAGVAMLIACMGLFGLAALAASRRAREIGVRKVLGATSGSVTRMLTTEVARLTAMACVVAWPPVYWAMRQWLAGFAHRIEMGMGLFTGPGLLALAVALATVSYHAVRASLANPVDALRQE